MISALLCLVALAWLIAGAASINPEWPGETMARQGKHFGICLLMAFVFFLSAWLAW